MYHINLEKHHSWTEHSRYLTVTVSDKLAMEHHSPPIEANSVFCESKSDLCLTLLLPKCVRYHIILKRYISRVGTDRYGKVSFKHSLFQRAIHICDGSCMYGRPHNIVWCVPMMMSSKGYIFGVTGPLCGEFTGHWWIPQTKASAGALMFLLSVRE